MHSGPCPNAVLDLVLSYSLDCSEYAYDTSAPSGFYFIGIILPQDLYECHTPIWITKSIFITLHIRKPTNSTTPNCSPWYLDRPAGPLALLHYAYPDPGLPRWPEIPPGCGKSDLVDQDQGSTPLFLQALFPADAHSLDLNPEASIARNLLTFLLPLTNFN